MIKIDKHVKTLEAARKDVFLQMQKQSVDDFVSGDLTRTVLGVYYLNQGIKGLKELAQE